MNKATLTDDNVTVQFNYADHADNDSNLIRSSGGAHSSLPPAVASQMIKLAAFLHTDIGATWALAGELSGGVPAMQVALFSMSMPSLAALGVGAAAYGATTALDKYFDGAIHGAFLEAIEMVGHLEHQVADRYFGGEGFSTESEPMMSEICSNWTDYWNDMPQVIAPIQHPLG
jgi:hypothetical protein